jgi:hypothetical protein
LQNSVNGIDQLYSDIFPFLKAKADLALSFKHLMTKYQALHRKISEDSNIHIFCYYSPFYSYVCVYN